MGDKVEYTKEQRVQVERDILDERLLEACDNTGEFDDVWDALEDGADINCFNGAPLKAAIKNGFDRIAEHLLSVGAKPIKGSKRYGLNYISSGDRIMVKPGSTKIHAGQVIIVNGYPVIALHKSEGAAHISAIRTGKVKLPKGDCQIKQMQIVYWSEDEQCVRECAGVNRYKMGLAGEDASVDDEAIAVILKQGI